MFTVADCVEGVVELLANRQDAREKAPKWIKDTILEFTESYTFKELQVTGPEVTLTPAVASYDERLLYNVGEDEVEEAVFFIYVDYPTNSTVRQIKFRNMPVVEPLTKISGLPVYWTRHGGNIYFGCRPQSAYTIYLKYRRKHPFSRLNWLEDRVYLPDSWQEIIEIGAAERGSLRLRMLDYFAIYQQALRGDADYMRTGGLKGKPGFLFGRTSQLEQDEDNNERSVPPTVMIQTGL